VIAMNPNPSHRVGGGLRRSLLLVAPALALLAACGAVKPGSVTVPLERLQSRIDARFPRRFPLAGLLELNLQAPSLQLRPEANRINAVMALEAAGVVLRRSYSGLLDIDFALRYERADQTVRAHDLLVNALQIDGLPPQTAQLLTGLAPRLAEQTLRDVVVYQLQPRDLATADRLGVVPGRITVTPAGLEIELVRPSA